MTAVLTSWKAIGPGLIGRARQSGHPLPAELTDPDHPPTPEQIVDFVRDIAATYFPGLAPPRRRIRECPSPIASEERIDHATGTR